MTAPEGATILETCRDADIGIPTLCYLDTLEAFNSCRVCVVEVEGSRTLVPACSREVTEGLTIQTESARVVATRKTVYELLASSVDLSLVDSETTMFMERYEVDLDRFGTADRPVRAVKIEDDLYIRDYDKCVMCFRCVAACGPDAQNTFAIDVAGRGLGATIATEFDIVLPDSACVYCGNCVGVCPSGALMFKTEFDLRASGEWRPEDQTISTTVCSFCGVGCNLELHVQDNRIVKVTSPMDDATTSGHLCIKGRFGWGYVQPEPDDGD
ncbi:MAG: Fe-S-binding domain-containing protein [Armatimonadetes bacterium]|nr:MAG: Fe-S-binding domain-containing protein [Armatimonadota bacterium]